jgi:hypothetical protein
MMTRQILNLDRCLVSKKGAHFASFVIDLANVSLERPERPPDRFPSPNSTE